MNILIINTKQKIFLFLKFLRLIQEELVKKRWLLQPVKPTTTTTVYEQ